MKGEILDAIQWLGATGQLAELAAGIGTAVAQEQARIDAESWWDVDYTDYGDAPTGTGWEPFHVSRSGAVVYWRRRVLTSTTDK